jgi:hypothetical protein
MANVNIEITLGTKGNDAGPLYDIYYSADCVTYTLASNNAYLPFVGSTTIIVVPDTTRCVKLVNLTSVCENNFVVSGSANPTTTTTLAPTTTTTTILPTTSTTTFSPDPCVCTEVVITSNGGEVQTFNCYGVNQNYVYFTAGTYYLCAARIGDLLQVFFDEGTTGTISPVGNCKTGACPPSPTTTTTTTLGASFCWKIYNPTAFSLTVEYYDTTNQPIIAGVPGGSTDWICVYGGTTPTDYEGGGLVIESCGIQCTSSDTCTNCVPPTTTIAPTTTTLACVNCGINQYGSYIPSDYYVYPDTNICNAVSSSNNLQYYAYDRPNRFTLYDSTGYITSSGWVGYADYAGPWGASLNVDPDGIIPFTFASSMGRYMRVEAGPADTEIPISDAYEWVLVCQNPITTTTTIAPTTTTTSVGATLNWSYSETGGANGTMDLYVNGFAVESRSSTASGTRTVYPGDTIYVELQIVTPCGSPDTYANVYTTGNILNDANCANNAGVSLTTGTYTVVSGDIGSTLVLYTFASCDGGCV